MESHYFSIGAVLKNGWAKFKEHPFTWIGALLLFIVIIGSHPYVTNLALGNPFVWDPSEQIQNATKASQGANALALFISFLYYLIHLGLGLGVVYMGLRATDGLSLNIFHLFARFYYVFHYLISSILYGLVVLAGLILLVFPAAIWGSKFALYPYFIVDKGAGPIHALKLSSEATKGYKWDVFAFILISGVVLLIGIALVLIGLLVVAPILNIAWASIYRKLTVVEESPAQSAPPVVEQVQSYPT